MGQLKNERLVDPILTNIARGFSNASLVSEELFPVVNVEKEGGSIPLFGKEDFIVWNTERALRADSNEKEGIGIGKTDYVLKEHDIVERLDKREIEEAIVDLEAMAAESATNSIALKREKLAAELALNPDTYETTNKVALTTGGYFDISTVDPVKEIGGYNDSLAELIGKRANTLIMGTKVWNRLKTHPLLKNYLIVPGTNQAPVVSSADLSKVLEIPKVIIAEAMYTEDKATFDFIWGNAILLAYVTPPSPLGRTPYQPCFGYTLRKNGYPVADAWWENNGKIRKVRSTDLFTNKVVGAESAFLINTPITPANY